MHQICHSIESLTAPSIPNNIRHKPGKEGTQVSRRMAVSIPKLQGDRAGIVDVDPEVQEKPTDMKQVCTDFSVVTLYLVWYPIPLLSLLSVF